MANLTITVDEETVKRARIRALEEGTSVNALLRDYLEDYAGVRRERMEAWRKIQDLARHSGMGSRGQRLPTREEIYNRPIMGNQPKGPL
jgi:plasmid stability protein